MPSKSTFSTAMTKHSDGLKEPLLSSSKKTNTAISLARTSGGVEKLPPSEPSGSTNGIVSQRFEGTKEYLKQWQENWNRISGAKHE